MGRSSSTPLPLSNEKETTRAAEAYDHVAQNEALRRFPDLRKTHGGWCRHRGADLSCLPAKCLRCWAKKAQKVSGQTGGDGATKRAGSFSRFLTEP